jgi:sodium/hydrogen antiporter
VSVADLAIIAALIFVWGTLSARLERFDMTATIVLTAAGVLLTHGPLAPLGVTPSPEQVRVLAGATLALVLFSDASRVGPCLRGWASGPLCWWVRHSRRPTLPSAPA